MNNATYYRKPPVSVVSPYQPKPQHPIELMRAKVYDTQDKENPIRAEIEKCIGTHTIKAVVEEDRQTLDAMGVDGLISFLCTMSKEGRVLSQGRGSAMIGPQNRFFQRAVACAFNSALADAAIRATKVLDQLRDRPGAEEAYTEESAIREKISDKQRSYLTTLVQKNIHDESTLTWWMNQINDMDTRQASEAIKSFVK